jgi:hypothetical protein
MKTTLEVCLILCFFGLPLYLTYWLVFRPVLMVRLRYRFFEARDELRLLVVTAGKQQNLQSAKAFPIIERFCNNGLSRIERVDIADFFLYRPDAGQVLEAKRDFELVDEAGPEMRRIFEQAQNAAVGAVLANSPGFVVVLAPLGCLAILIYWFTKARGLVLRFQERSYRLFCAVPSPTCA